MVRVLSAIAVAAVATQAAAFVPASSNGRVGTDLSLTKIQTTKKVISNLDSSNFESSLAEIEPYLLNDAGASIYKKSLRRIGTAATRLGVSVPADYAKDAKATQKRREKQDAFIQQKEAERLEAEAAAAEAEAPAEEVAEPEPEPVEA